MRYIERWWNYVLPRLINCVKRIYAEAFQVLSECVGRLSKTLDEIMSDVE